MTTKERAFRKRARPPCPSRPRPAAADDDPRRHLSPEEIQRLREAADFLVEPDRRALVVGFLIDYLDAHGGLLLPGRRAAGRAADGQLRLARSGEFLRGWALQGEPLGALETLLDEETARPSEALRGWEFGRRDPGT